MKATRCQECGFFTETTRCQHCGSIVVPKQPMTKDELRKGLRETFSLINQRTLFWQYIGQLEKRIAELENDIEMKNEAIKATIGIKNKHIARLKSLLKAQEEE